MIPHTRIFKLKNIGSSFSVEFRLARENDLTHIIDISNSTSRFQMSKYTGTSPYEELLFWVKDPRSLFLVASNDTKILGYAYGFFISPKWFSFDAIAIDRRYQNCGIGAYLYSILRAECKKLGIELINGLVKDCPNGTLNYWINQGFDVGYPLIWVEDWLCDE